MIDWTARANAVFAKNPRTPTAKTDETPISSVSSVGSEGVSEKSQPGFVGFVGTSPEAWQKNEIAGKAANRWLLHFPDGVLEVTFAPAVRHAEALRRYPLAVAAEPLADPAPVWMPDDLRALLLPLSLDDRALAREMYAIDPEGTRLLLEGMAKR